LCADFNGKVGKSEEDRRQRRRLRLIDACKQAGGAKMTATPSRRQQVGYLKIKRSYRRTYLVFDTPRERSERQIAKRLTGQSPSLQLAQQASSFKNKKGALRRLFSSNNDLIWQCSS